MLAEHLDSFAIQRAEHCRSSTTESAPSRQALGGQSVVPTNPLMCLAPTSSSPLEHADSAQFTTITTEGGLLPSDLISRLVNDTRSLPGTREEDYWTHPRPPAPGDHQPFLERHARRMASVPASGGTAVARRPHGHLDVGSLAPATFRRAGIRTARSVSRSPCRWRQGLPDQSPPRAGLRPSCGMECRLDRRTAGVAGAAKAAPHSMVQELLNRTDEHLWAILSNGRQLRILRDNSSLTRAAYVEFDLEQMFSEGIFTDFVAFGFSSTPAASKVTRRASAGWKSGPMRPDSKVFVPSTPLARDLKTPSRPSGRVSGPSRQQQLRERLRDGELSKQDYYRQLLRVVYRLVFLLVAEDRSLLHPPMHLQRPRSATSATTACLGFGNWLDDAVGP